MTINQLVLGRNLGAPRNLQSIARPSSEVNPDGGSDEVSLKVTESMLNAAEFQRELANYARTGLRLRVEMMPEGSFALPTPSVRTAPATPVASVQGGSSKKLIGASGVACAALGVAACAGLGALGGCFAIDVMVDRVGPTLQKLSNQGAAGLLLSGLSDSALLAKAFILGNGVAAGIGGGVLGQAIGRLVGTAIAEPASLAGKLRPKLSKLGALCSGPQAPSPMLLTCQFGLTSGLIGGYIAGGCIGAVAIGTAGAVGSYKAAEWLGQGVKSLFKP